MLAAALILLPLAILDPPREAPGGTALAGLVGLILIPTFAGQLLLFRMLRLYGSRKLSIVTYLMPAFAVVYGAILLDEPITAAMLVGFGLIAIGAALASGQRFFGIRVQETPA
jgi:drug/metabolite transporter (DMT)-like permease